MQYCTQNSCTEFDRPLVTKRASILMTERRLQLAISSGMTVTSWTLDSIHSAHLICELSLEPVRVLTILRVHGVPWSPVLCEGAEYYDKLTLLHWLHSHSCPWDEETLLICASMSGSVPMLEWLLTVTSPWSSELKQMMLTRAACSSDLEVVQWLKAHGADWPIAFFKAHHEYQMMNMC
jgi:hypothetical protein